MKRSFSLLLLLALTPCLGAQSVKLPARIDTKVGKLVGPIEVEVDGKMEDYQLLKANPDDAVLFQVVAPAGKLQFIFQANRQGTYYILVTASKAGKFKNGFTVLVAEGAEPAPVPVPPGPTPTPTPTPVPVPQGFRAVLAYESSANMTKEQLAALYSPRVSKYLDSKTQDGAKGWRRWDKDVDVKYEPELWKQLWAAAKPMLGQLPAVVVVVGAKGEVFPFSDETVLMQILERYGGK